MGRGPCPNDKRCGKSPHTHLALGMSRHKHAVLPDQLQDRYPFEPRTSAGMAPGGGARGSGQEQSRLLAIHVPKPDVAILVA